MIIPPPLLLVGAIILSLLASILAPGLRLGGPPLSLLGIGFISAGIGLFLWSVKLFQKHETTLKPRGKPSSLITVGPYRASRNPIYLGFLCISIGTAILFANVLAFVGPLVFFYFINTLVIPFEEDMLTNTFGSSYQDYRMRTRRWL
ncbi:isoprenylcysteine carboxylmethyltransferase family protein [Candidatus Gottesmanbacteria bacterium]|nr:isoprenylcysteine carboxylmethyltransferase family protein [Candidatus Gottesmanbacteria bacterium]